MKAPKHDHARGIQDSTCPHYWPATRAPRGPTRTQVTCLPCLLSYVSAAYSMDECVRLRLGRRTEFGAERLGTPEVQQETQWVLNRFHRIRLPIRRVLAIVADKGTGG